MITLKSYYYKEDAESSGEYWCDNIMHDEEDWMSWLKQLKLQFLLNTIQGLGYKTFHF